MRKFQSNTGIMEPDRVTCVPQLHKSGHCVFGGDLVIWVAGLYIATCEITIDPCPSCQDPLVVLDIYENLQSKTILATRAINSADLVNQPCSFSLEFSAKVGQRVEFRIFWAGQCRLSVSRVTISRLGVSRLRSSAIGSKSDAAEDETAFSEKR